MPPRHGRRKRGAAQVNTPTIGVSVAPATCSSAESDPTKQSTDAIRCACARMSCAWKHVAFASGSASRCEPIRIGQVPAARSSRTTSTHVARGQRAVAPAGLRRVHRDVGTAAVGEQATAARQEEFLPPVLRRAWLAEGLDHVRLDDVHGRASFVGEVEVDEPVVRDQRILCRRAVRAVAEHVGISGLHDDRVAGIGPRQPPHDRGR